MAKYNDYGWRNGSFTEAHSYILPALLKMLSEKNKVILDVGCGNVAIANFLIGEGYNVYGIDASSTGIKLANKISPDRFFKQDLTYGVLPVELSELQFTTIISTEVIEHMYNPRQYVAFCRNILEKNGGGELIISTPYHGYLKNLAIALCNGYDRHFTALWDGGHIKFWSYKTLTMLLEEFGFEVVEFQGVGRLHYLSKSMIIKAVIN